MPCLTHWGRDKMTTILHIISKCIFFKRLKISLQCVRSGVDDYKMKIGPGNGLAPSRHQAITSGSVVIRVNGVYMRLSDWLSWLLHRFGKYIDAEKNGTVWAHGGYLHPRSWKWAIPTRRVGSGRGTGWPWFVKCPLAAGSRSHPPPYPIDRMKPIH